jgi:serine/threonine-protein kinase
MARSIMDTDLNLLFGVLALQADLISAGQFVEACTAWAARKDKPLAELLIERGWITATDQADVERLLKRKLKHHSQDARASLVAVLSADWRSSLGAVDDPEIVNTVANLKPNGAPESLIIPLIPLTRERYTLTRMHATGGIGRIWLARDDHLGRNVALKELRAEQAEDPANGARFLREARVTGQLEHPGIVPVYELAKRSENQQPFYTMRFVEGRTLSAAAASYHQQRSAGKADPFELRSLLNAFVAVCNAIAYSHARGVVHRDLKGNNVLLGEFGEVLVLDWGLAKVLGQAEEGVQKSPVQVDQDVALQATLQGQVMGTPAYMAPEQAAGQVDWIGPRTDVYGLGAILYEILTGQPPFTGADSSEVLLKVQTTEPARPRQLWPGVPAALEAVCLHALAKKPEARYPSAREVGQEVQRWLADEPVMAYPERWTTRLGRWVRRHRGLTAGAAGLLITAVAALAIGLVAVDNQKQRAKRALAAEAQAKRRTRQALDEMSSQVIANWLARQPGKLEPAQAEFLQKALAYYREFAQESGDSEEVRSSVAKAHGRTGVIARNLGQHKMAEEAYRSAVACYQQLATDIPSRVDYRQELAAIHNRLGLVLHDTGRPQDAEQAYRNALALRRQLTAEFPAVPDYRYELAMSHSNRARLLRDTGRLGEAEEAYREALTLQKQLAAEFPAEPGYRRELAVIHNDLGIVLRLIRRPQDAESACDDAIALLKQLAAEFPAEPIYRQQLGAAYNNLGILLRDSGRHKEAEEAYREALTLKKQLTAEFPAVPGHRHDLAMSYSNLGNLLRSMGRAREAEEAFRGALTLQRQLAVEFPKLPDYSNNVAGSMVNLALLLRDLEDYSQARPLLESAVPYHQAALTANPQNPTYREFFQKNRIALASVLAGLGDHNGAGQIAEQLAALGWNPADDDYAAGCALARCIPVTEKNAKLHEAERRELVRSYTDRALAMLRQASAKGYKDMAGMKKAKDLVALQSHPDFLKLLNDLETKARSRGN